MKTIAVLAVAGLSTGAFAQVMFYANDEATFLSDLAGAPQLGVLEDMENNTAADGIVETLTNPLAGGVPNGSFTMGLRNAHLTVSALDDNGDGLDDMVLLTDGFIGETTDVVGSNQFADSTGISSSTALLALSFDLWSLVGGATSYDIEVFDSAGALIGTFTTPNQSEPMFIGMIADGAQIGSVRIAGVTDTGELVDNISTYVPTPGSIALLGVAGLFAARRRR